MSVAVAAKPVSLYVMADNLMCDCHGMVWHVDDLTSEDGRSLDCPATRAGIAIETER